MTDLYPIPPASVQVVLGRVVSRWQSGHDSETMPNKDTRAAWDYHDRTKHSYQSIRANRHYLDWENQPIPFKIYSDLKPMPLPQHLSSSRAPALAAIATTGEPLAGEVRLNRQLLAEILYLSAGITKRRRHPGGEMLFRAAACTGALYHIDLYLVSSDLEDLEAGVYHFGPHDFALRRLRRGDYRGAVARATGEEPATLKAQAILIFASTFWRNAWKYQARTYRHCYWDNGTILANLLAGATARGMPTKVILGFIDATISRLLGLDAQREAPLSVVALGTSGEIPSATEALPSLEPLALATAPLSKEEVDYPQMRIMHGASSLETEEEVRAWRKGRLETTEQRDKTGRPEEIFPLELLDDADLPRDSIEEVIVRRGSTRQFARESISFAQLSTMLDRATRGIAGDVLDPAATPLNDLYLIVHAVECLEPGAYYYRRDERALERLKAGDFRRDAGHLGLGQEIPADCSVNLYFLADLERALARFGNRGYRVAQLEASIMGGKLYLAAYAQRLGASGLTFFDDDVTDFFSPHARGKSVMFLTALGKSAKRKTV
jgi:SagB-type dehydrogenase family enzyme